MESDDSLHFAVDIIIKVTPGHDIDSFMELVDDWLGPCAEDECICGMVSMGGTQGTLDQCWNYQRIGKSWAIVKSEDLRHLLGVVEGTKERDTDVESRLWSEANWWDE